MTTPALALAPEPDTGPGAGAITGDLLTEVLQLAASDQFRRWESQLQGTGHCSAPIRLAGRVEAIDRATGHARPMYDTAAEPGGVLLVACGNRREHVCPSCSQVYKRDARQLIRAGLTGGKGIPGTVAGHPCVFATLTAPSFGPVHAARTGRRGQLLPCRPRRDYRHRRCPHGRDISCPRTHRDGDPLLGQPLCPRCYDYTGHVLFNALAPELWRRFTIYLPRRLAALAGITRTQLRDETRARFVKVAEYQARGIIHYHAVIRLDHARGEHQPPPPRYDTALLAEAIGQAAAAVSCDTVAVLAAAIRRARGPGAADPVIDPGLGRILRFGTQADTRPIRATGDLPATGQALPAPAVANYIAKYATKATGTPGMPDRPLRGPAAINALRCTAHYKQLITTCWDLARHPDAAPLALNRWTHMLGYGGHFLTKSRAYSVTFGQLRNARTDYQRTQRHPEGEKDPWGRDLDHRTVLIEATWAYTGTGHATTAERALALAAAARAREHHQAAADYAPRTA